jgi:hypothetical protein
VWLKSLLTSFPTAVEVSSATDGSNILVIPAVVDILAVVGFPAVAGVSSVAKSSAVAHDPVLAIALILLDYRTGLPDW